METMRERGTDQFQYPQYRIDVPPLIRRKSFGSQTNLSCHSELELVVCDLEECQKLSYQYSDVALINQSIGKLQCTPTDGNIPVAEAVKDDVAMTLHGGCVDCDYFVEGVEGDVANAKMSRRTL